LTSAYPQDGRSYLVAWIIAAGCFAWPVPARRIESRIESRIDSRRGFTPSRAAGRRIFLVAALSLIVAGRSEVPAPIELGPPEFPLAVPGTTLAEVERVSRGRHSGQKQLHIRTLGENSSRGVVSAPDLPWPPYVDLREGAVTRVSFQLKGDLAVGRKDLRALPPWSYEWYLARQGVSFSAHGLAFTILRPPPGEETIDRLIRGILSRMKDSDGLSIILASSLGRGELLAQSTEELFRRTGTTHLLVVSGFHVGVIARAVGFAAQVAFGRVPMVFLILPAPVIGAAVGLLVAGIYGWFIGFSLTVARALVMLGVVTAGSALGRRHDSLRSILFALILMLTIWPGCIFEPGCELTFMALAGLGAGDNLAKLVREIYVRPDSLEAALGSTHFRMRALCDRLLLTPLCVCSAVSLATAPITLLWFQQLVPLSPLINVAFIPLFTAVVIGAGGIALFLFAFSPAMAIFLLRIAATLTEESTELLRRVEALTAGTIFGARHLEWIASLSLGILYLIVFLAVAVLPKHIRFSTNP